MDRSSSGARPSHSPPPAELDRKSADGKAADTKAALPGSVQRVLPGPGLPSFAARPDDDSDDDAATPTLANRHRVLPESPQQVALHGMVEALDGVRVWPMDIARILNAATDMPQLLFAFDALLARLPPDHHGNICHDAYRGIVRLGGDPLAGLRVIERRLGPVMTQPLRAVLSFAGGGIHRTPAATVERVARLFGGATMTPAAMEDLLAVILRFPSDPETTVAAALRALVAVAGDAPPTLRRIADAVATSRTLPSWPLEERVGTLLDALVPDELGWDTRERRLKALADVMALPMLAAAMPGRNWRGEAPDGAAPAPDKWITTYARRLASLPLEANDPAPVLDTLLAALAQDAHRLRPRALELAVKGILGPLQALARHEGLTELPQAQRECLDRYPALSAAKPPDLAQLAKALKVAEDDEDPPPLPEAQVEQVLATARWEAAPSGGAALRVLHQAALQRLRVSLAGPPAAHSKSEGGRESKHAAASHLLARLQAPQPIRVDAADLLYLYDEMSTHLGVMDLLRHRIPPAPAPGDEGAQAQAATRQRQVHAQRLEGVRPQLRRAFAEVRRLLAPISPTLPSIDQLAEESEPPALQPAESDSATVSVAKALLRRLLLDFRAVQAFEASFHTAAEPLAGLLVISDGKASR